MDEIWKDIYFWENGIEWDYRELYQVSNCGRIKSLNYNHTGKEKILKAGKRTDYEFVILCKNNKRKNFLIHRLVAHMFLSNDNPIEKIEVNHKDENKTNNHVENLEWCNREYNINFGIRNEKASESMKGKNKGKKSGRAILVDRFTLDGQYVDTMYPFEYVRIFNFNQTGISHCCKGRIKSTGGYVFKYHEEE